MGPFDGKEQLEPSTLAGCERFLGRPNFRKHWPIPRPGLDEICSLEIPTFSSTEMNLKSIRANVDYRQISAICPSIRQSVRPGAISCGTPLLENMSKFEVGLQVKSYRQISAICPSIKQGVKSGVISLEAPTLSNLWNSELISRMMAGRERILGKSDAQRK